MVFLSTFFLLIGVYCPDPTKPDFFTDEPQISLLIPGTLDTINNVFIGITVYDTIEIGIERYIPEFIDSIRLDIADDTTFLLKNTPDTTISADYDTIRISFVFTEPGEKIISACAFISSADSNCSVSLKMLIAGKSATILKHPDSLTTVTEGDTAMLTVSATGSDTIRYQWYKYDSLLTGCINDTLIIPVSQISDSGIYTCVVNNGWGEPDTSDSAIIRMLPKNKGPVWNNDSLLVSIAETDTLTLSLKDSCTDPNGDTLLFLLAEGMPPGDTINDSGIYTFVTDYTSAGQYLIAITASDSEYVDSLIIFLSVTNVNQKPFFRDSMPDTVYTINEGNPLVIPIYAEDADGDTVTCFLSEITLPRPDLVHFVSDTITWQSLKGDNGGSFQITVAATDSIDTAFASITIIIQDVNFPPVLDSIPDTTITEGMQIIFTARASDVDGDSLALTAANLPAEATFTDNGNGTGSFNWQTTYNDSGAYIVKMLASDRALADSQFVTIRVLDSKFTIIATASPGGTISPADTIFVEYGANQKFDITPNTGYHIADVLVDGVSVGAVSTYNFTLMANNHTIHAVFAINTYTLTVAGGANGTTIPSGDSLVNHGAATQIIAVPANGFHFIKWECSSGTALIADTLADTTTVTLNSGNATVTAQFEINTYTLSALTQGNGTVTVSPLKPLYTHGDTVTLTAKADTGNHFTGWSGDVSDTTNPLTIIIAAQTTITANFAIDEYEVNVTASGSGAVVPAGVQNILYGDTLSVTATPAANYHFVSWTVSGGVTITDGDATGEFTITGNGTIIANFAIDQHTVTFVSGTNGSITGTLSQTIDHGGSATAVTAVPDANYGFSGWTGDYTGMDNPLTVTNVTADMTITANFAQYTVTFLADTTYGSLTGTLVQTIAHGSDCSPVTAVPKTNYHLTTWTGDYTDSDNPLTVTNVTADMTITANFGIDSFTVTFEAGANGSLTGTLVQAIPYGSNCTPVTAVPDDNYTFTEWHIQGHTINIDFNNPVTITNVRSDISVQSEFVKGTPVPLDSVTGLRSFDAGGEVILLTFSAVKKTEDRTIAHFDISSVSGTNLNATLVIPISNSDPNPPDGTFDVYSFEGDGAVSIDEWNLGTLVHHLTGISGSKQTLECDVSASLNAAKTNGANHLSFNFRHGGGDDRYSLGSFGGVPDCMLLVSQSVIIRE